MAYLALEAFTNEVEHRLKFRHLSQLAWGAQDPDRGRFSYASWMSGVCDGVEARHGKEAERLLVAELENLSTFYRDQEFTVTDVIDRLSSLRGRADLILFDHLHFVDLPGEDENRAMKGLCKTLSDLVNELEVPVVAIAHLRKHMQRRGPQRIVPDLHEFHGTSDIVKIATKVVTLARAWDYQPSDPFRVGTFLRVEKDRLAGKTPYVALAEFDVRSSGYAAQYMLGKVGTEFKHVPVTEQPWWAKRGQ